MLIKRAITTSIACFMITSGIALEIGMVGLSGAEATTHRPTILRGGCCRPARSFSVVRNLNRRRDVHNIVINNKFEISNISKSDGVQSQRLADKTLGVSSSASAAGGGGGGGGEGIKNKNDKGIDEVK